MKWLARRRFNHVDVVGILLTFGLFNAGFWMSAVACWIGFLILSIIVENAAYAKGD